MATMSDTDLLARLVAFKTVSGSPTAPLVDWVCDYLDRPGITCVRDEAEPGFVNLIATVGPDAPKDDRAGLTPGLTLCGHLDVVPADEPGWTSDPFELTVRDDRLVARGACDMKGFCALAINRLLATDPRDLRHPLAVLLTFDEEVGSRGAAHFAARADDHRLPRSVLVGEPTSLRAVRMHKGHLKMRIVVHGKAAHTGSPHLGVNAIDAAMPALGVLAELRKHWSQKRHQHASLFPDVPFPVLTVARIRAGDALNVIPDRCEIDIGARLMPGMESDDAVSVIRKVVRDVTADDVQVDIDVINDNPPLLTLADAPLHEALCAILEQRDSVGVSFASDGGWLNRAGYECVLCGPGSIEVAHKPDEYLPIDAFERAGAMLDMLIERMCRQEVAAP
jgi:acetylornithine deacetylase